MKVSRSCEIRHTVVVHSHDSHAAIIDFFAIFRIKIIKLLLIDIADFRLPETLFIKEYILSINLIRLKTNYEISYGKKLTSLISLYNMK